MSFRILVQHISTTQTNVYIKMFLFQAQCLGQARLAPPRFGTTASTAYLSDSGFLYGWQVTPARPPWRLPIHL